jgi:hypothetical protein
MYTSRPMSKHAVAAARGAHRGRKRLDLAPRVQKRTKHSEERVGTFRCGVSMCQALRKRDEDAPPRGPGERAQRGESGSAW